MVPQSQTWATIRGRAAIAEVAIMAGTAVMLLAKVTSGSIVYYIHPRYSVLVVCAALLLLLAAAAQLRHLWHQPKRQIEIGHVLLCIPLLLGTLLPDKPLGASALSGLSEGSAPAGVLAPADDNTDTWNLLQLSTALSIRGSEINGRDVDLTGFVYQNHGETNAFDLARYVITCCTADSNGIRIAVVWAGSSNLAPDQWVRVQGRVGSINTNGRNEPAIIATTVTTINQPEYPYLYP